MIFYNFSKVWLFYDGCSNCILLHLVKHVWAKFICHVKVLRVLFCKMWFFFFFFQKHSYNICSTKIKIIQPCVIMFTFVKVQLLICKLNIWYPFPFIILAFKPQNYFTSTSTQCGNYKDLLSNFFDKNSVKAKHCFY